MTLPESPAMERLPMMGAYKKWQKDKKRKKYISMMHHNIYHPESSRNSKSLMKCNNHIVEPKSSHYTLIKPRIIMDRAVDLTNASHTLTTFMQQYLSIDHISIPYNFSTSTYHFGDCLQTAWKDCPTCHLDDYEGFNGSIASWKHTSKQLLGVNLGEQKSLWGKIRCNFRRFFFLQTFFLSQKLFVIINGFL